MTGKISKNKNIALCLSGGGLRATLFHLGVVKQLRLETIDNAPALHKVTEIYSVSGGSILAAHMLKNWSLYSGSDQDFSRAEEELIAFAQRNLRDRILRRSLLTRLFGLGLVARFFLKRINVRFPRGPLFVWLFGRGRTYWLRKEYEALLGKNCFANLPKDAPTPALPIGYLLTTSFQTGELCSFSNSHFEIESHMGGMETSLRSTSCGAIRLSFAVAASSAFPPMFPPLELNDDLLSNPKDPYFRNALYLSDGGVFDNLGIEKFKNNVKRGYAHPSTVILSDAGGAFRAEVGEDYDGMIGRNVRTSEILMHRVGDQAKTAFPEFEDEYAVKVIPIRISDTLPKNNVDEAAQQRIRLIRTDLDRFEPDLAHAILDHGNRLSNSIFQKHRSTVFGNTGCAFEASQCNDIEQFDALVGKASKRSFLSFLFTTSDWRTIIPIWSACGLMLFILGYSAQSYMETNRCETATVEINERVLADVSDLLEQGKPNAAKSALASVPLDLEANAKGCEILERRASTRDGSSETQQNDTSFKHAVSPEDVSSISDELQSSLSSPATDKKIFIQFAGFSRQSVRDLNNALRNAGWRMQSSSGERLKTAQKKNEVRYSGNNEKVAQELANSINRYRGTSGLVKAQEVSAIRGDVLEIWISYVGPTEGLVDAS